MVTVALVASIRLIQDEASQYSNMDGVQAHKTLFLSEVQLSTNW